MIPATSLGSTTLVPFTKATSTTCASEPFVVSPMAGRVGTHKSRVGAKKRDTWKLAAGNMMDIDVLPQGSRGH